MAGAALFFWGAVVAPAVHLSAHASHVADPESIDVQAMRDSTTGRVDLSRLAEALGLGDHDANEPHHHGPGPEHHHGDGSLEHLMLALAGGAPILVAPLVLPFERAVEQEAREVTRALSLHFLISQRAQAPPV